MGDAPWGLLLIKPLLIVLGIGIVIGVLAAVIF